MTLAATPRRRPDTNAKARGQGARPPERGHLSGHAHPRCVRDSESAHVGQGLNRSPLPPSFRLKQPVHPTSLYAFGTLRRLAIADGRRNAPRAAGRCETHNGSAPAFCEPN